MNLLEKVSRSIVLEDSCRKVEELNMVTSAFEGFTGSCWSVTSELSVMLDTLGRVVQSPLPLVARIAGQVDTAMMMAG